MLQESQDTGSDSHVYAQYAWDPRYIDTPICRFDASGAAQYYTTDANNNVTSLVAPSTGQVVERYSYGSYGTVTVADEDWTGRTSGSIFGNEILYCGYRYDSETGNYCVRNRTYSPAMATFISRDPAQDGSNLYEYVHDSPANSTDPTGLFDLYYHEQLMRSAVKDSGFSDDVVLALVVYNMEADIKANVDEYSKALREIQNKADIAVRGVNELLNAQKSIFPYEGSRADMMASYYRQLHMDNLFDAGYVTSYWQGTIRDIMLVPEAKLLLSKLDWWGNQWHKLQDGFAHSNFAELTSGSNPKMDPSKAKSLYDVFGPYYSTEKDGSAGVPNGSWDSTKLKGLITGAYGEGAKPTGAKTHDDLNKDNATRDYFKIAYASAEKTGREIAADWVNMLKTRYPDLYCQMTKPLTDNERNALKAKYALYKKLADSVGHWQSEPKETK